MESEAWLASFQAKAEEMRNKADLAREQLAVSAATASSADGAITVTVGPGGVLQGLTFGPRIKAHSPDRLAELVMEVFGQAQAESATGALAAFTSLGYSDDAIAQFRQFMPSTQTAAEPEVRPDDEDDDDEWQPSRRFGGPRG